MAEFKRSYFDDLQDYIQGGSKEDLSSIAQEYLDVLYLLNNLRRKYGKENAIAFIQKPPLSIKYRRARLMYDEAINLFYADDGIEKQALRNLFYEEFNSAAQVVLLTAKDSKDMEVYGDLKMKAYKAKELDVPEPPKVPEELYKKPNKIYTLEPKHIKLERANRDLLAARIDNMEIPNSEKTRLRMEAEIEDIDFIELFDEQEKKTKAE